MSLPKRHSGINKLNNKHKYERGVTYKSTSKSKVEKRPDPEGRYYDPETKERVSIIQIPAENPGFKEIAKAPIGSVIVVHQPETRWNRPVGLLGAGIVDEHDEYYEIFERRKSMSSQKIERYAKFRKTTEPTGCFLMSGRLYFASNFLNHDEVYDGQPEIYTAKRAQRAFPLATKLTIYKPKEK